MSLIKYALFILIAFAHVSSASAQDAPLDPDHPGSTQYLYSFEYKKIEIDKRSVEFYLPKLLNKSGSPTEKFPVIIFGHGQALNSSHYNATFEHLAQKGVAVIFPMYDRNFFDMNWSRMAKDFKSLALKAVEQTPSIDRQRVVYSGHSKGAYVAILAAAIQPVTIPHSLLLFVPAEIDQDALLNLNPKTPLTLIRGESDNIIKESIVTNTFKLAPNLYKQYISVKNYPNDKANHFFMVNKKTVFGGFNEPHPFHFYGSWKWLLGAALDLNHLRLSNPYLYGDQADSTGIEGLKHDIIRNW